jgi:hypothetical protein
MEDSEQIDEVNEVTFDQVQQDLDAVLAAIMSIKQPVRPRI